MIRSWPTGSTRAATSIEQQSTFATSTAASQSETQSVFYYKPAFSVAIVFTLLWLVMFQIGDSQRTNNGFLAWYASVLWTIPGIVSLTGFTGAALTRRRSYFSAEPQDIPLPVDQALIVVVPTIGRPDSLAALTRVVGSFEDHLPGLFTTIRVDIVVEEDCEALLAIESLAAMADNTRIVVVPADYQTVNNTHFKARASQYAAEDRRARGESHAGVWILHMDDDTGIAADTAYALAEYVGCEQAAGDDARYLAQGLLVYPRELASSRLAWMADAVRPACDASLFVRSTATGAPGAGLHGELLLVRSDIEDSIGWDFGPRSIVEDADFALRFCDRYPGRSGWLKGRSIGASPASVADLLRQRERWVWGLLELLVSSTVSFRSRALLSIYVLVWVLSPFGHPLVIAAIALTGGHFGTRPVISALAPIWAINVGYVAWVYWDGMRINRASSKPGTTSWRDQAMVLVAAPLLSLLECLGVLRALVRFLRRSTCNFHVIKKPI